MVYGNNNWATSIYGVTPDYLTIRDLSVADGAEFTQQDVDSANKVAVLGRTPVNNLFGGADPIGQTIRIKNVPFTVVGVLTRQRPIVPGTGPGRCDSASDFQRQAKSDRRASRPMQTPWTPS